MIKIDLIEALKKQIIFCQENRRYSCGVFVTTEEKKEIIMNIISSLLPLRNRNVKLIKKINEAYAKFSNGNIIKILFANHIVRGQMFNGAIVDSTIDKGIIDTVIRPYLIPLYTNENIYDTNDNPINRMYCICISGDYVTSARGSGKTIGQLKDIMDLVSYDYSIRSINYDESIFEKEYKCMFYENDYNKPVVEKELNGDKVMLYEAWGIPKSLITYSTEFVNKTKQTYLNVAGKHEDPNLGFKNDINIHLLIDTNIYDGYEVHIEDGMVTVVLHEIKNEAPVLKDYGAA